MRWPRVTPLRPDKSLIGAVESLLQAAQGPPDICGKGRRMESGSIFVTRLYQGGPGVYVKPRLMSFSEPDARHRQGSAKSEISLVIGVELIELFYIGSGHDSWVIGDEPYVSLH